MKHFIWVFSFLPIVGIALFYLLDSPAAPSLASASAMKPSAPRQAPSRAALPAETKTARAMTEAEQAFLRTRRINEGMARYAATMSPDQQRNSVDAAMRVREPGYRSLFQSWSLDSAAIDKALDIIREREIHLVQKRMQYFQKGLSGTTEHQKEEAVEGAIAEVQLVALLGQDHFNELSHQESERRTKTVNYSMARSTN